MRLSPPPQKVREHISTGRCVRGKTNPQATRVKTACGDPALIRRLPASFSFLEGGAFLCYSATSKAEPRGPALRVLVKATQPFARSSDLRKYTGLIFHAWKTKLCDY